MKLIKEHIEESTLSEATTSRIYRRLTDKNTCAIISAFRGDNTLEENMSLHRRLKADVRALKLGFNEFISRWVEDGIAYDERSLLIPHITKEQAIALGEKYNQSSIIWKDENECVEICTNSFETYSPGDIVRTYNNAGEHVLNIKEAEEIFAKRRGGPASKPVKGSNSKPFNLNQKVESFELYEVLSPRPSYFQKEERYVKIL